MAEIIWSDEARKRLERIPHGFMRSMTQSRVEKFAQEKGAGLITLEIAEEAIGEARKAMTGMMGGIGKEVGGGRLEVKTAFASNLQPPASSTSYHCNLCGYIAEGSTPEKCPACGAGKERFELVDKASLASSEPIKELKWTPDAMERLEKIPAGFMRDMTRWRIEKMARGKGLSIVSRDVIQEKFDYWAEGSAKVQKRLPWTKEADEKIERIPSSVRGMVIKEIEALAEKRGLKEVPPKLLAEAKEKWGASMEFHSEPVSVGETLVVSRNREGTSPSPTRDFHGKTHQDEFLEQLKRDVFSHEAVNHPFLERFSKGNLSEEQIKTFAIHYYRHAKMFSHYIANIIPKIPHERDRIVMVKNLMEEYGNLNPEKTHPALFRKFLSALELKKADWKRFKPIPEVTNFIDRITMLTRYEPFLVGLGAVGPGVEWVIPTMFKKILKGIRNSIAVKDDDLEYWTSHIILDVEHGDEATKVLMHYLKKEKQNMVRTVAIGHYPPSITSLEEKQNMVRTGAMKSLEARKLLWDGFERLLGF